MLIDKYNQRVDAINSLLCVGLDPDFDKLPTKFKQKKFPQFEFNRWIIEQTAEYAAAFKPNIAFYEARGEQGIHELKMTMDFLIEQYPDIFTSCDAKRADIGNTNNGYAKFIFDWLGFDSITLHPYLGSEALKPFLDRKDKVSIILCRTSNSGAGEFQDLVVDGQTIWEIVAEKVANEWNKNSNCMLVVGATYPEEMKRIREITPGVTFLVPGVGAQGGDVGDAVRSGLDKSGKGLMINSARGIIFSEDPAKAAKALRDEINQYR
ncbi:orotidine 5'-phosphate decarboxylase [Candidatus Saccharibacteria bacterium RIFCSPHIGHO2_12_FULL_41_12]|nr:MAG: orotidine 5'-phosphate decarboxylase [Candidatus Saccharibacteria bacterium RIFCSPHIGHO2_12_FULL_41_12]